MDPEQEKMIEFERHLKVFLWPTADNASGVRDMNQIDKFKGKHEEAAASYIKWLADGYPRVKVENREIQRNQHLSNLYKIFRTHCPEHDIFMFIDDQEQE